MNPPASPLRFLLVLPFLAVSPGVSPGATPSLDDLRDPGAEVKQLATDMAFTEGPVWLPKEKILVFSDIPNSKLMKWSEAGGLGVYRESEQPNGNILDLEGRLVTCQHGGRNLVRAATGGEEVEVVVDSAGGKRLNSPNDVAVRSDGSIWFTDPSYGLRGQPGELDGRFVFRLPPGAEEPEVVYRGFDMPNGVVFSPDEKRVYISDTGRVGKVRAFDVPAEGPLGEPVWEADVRSDGMCVDEAGNLYTTTGEGIQVFSPEGEMIGTVEVPEQPANACFGGEDYKTLFITARTSLYAVPMKVAGAKPKGAKW